MRQYVVAFTGISGVGKTTFLKKLAKLMLFQHVTGGSLIALAKNTIADGRDNLRYADLDENQRLLIEGFKLARDPSVELVIMDGHVVIDDGECLAKISSDVFKALDVRVMVHLEDDPANIVKNRYCDAARSRPKYDNNTLERHQDMSRQSARAIAEKLRIGFHIVTHNDAARLVKLLKSMPSK